MTPSDEELARLKRAKEIELDRLLSIPGVHAVGIGYKRRNGQLTDELGVVAYVDRKQPREAVKPEWLIPPEIRFFFGSTEEETVVRTDVVELSRFVEYSHIAAATLKNRARPTAGGYSIRGSGEKPNGTLGGWLWDDVNHRVVLLTCRHVLGHRPGTPVAVYQPWSSAVEEHFADRVRAGTMDAAIAAPLDRDDAIHKIEGDGPAVFETTKPIWNMPVEKTGAETGHTTGWISNLAVTVDWHPGSTNDFVVESDFSFFRDSGSLIVETSHPGGAAWKRVVGVLWGGTETGSHTIAHPIEDVFDDVGLSTICGGAIAQLVDSLFLGAFPQLPGYAPNGLARKMGQELERSHRGRELVDLVRQNRVALAFLALDPDFRSALAGGVAPFVEGLWTIPEILDRPVRDEDIARFERVLRTAVQIRPDLQRFVDRAQELLAELAGRSIAEVMS